MIDPQLVKEVALAEDIYRELQDDANQDYYQEATRLAIIQNIYES